MPYSSFSSSSSSKIKARLLIDKEQKRVVFSEAGSDFVDLFSFLTLPLGHVVHLLSNQSGLVSLDNLYESVKQLNANNLQTEACWQMLLNPQSAAALQCEDLKITGIHEPNPRSIYTCSQNDCLISSTCYYTYTSTCLCSNCGKLMDRAWDQNISYESGGFLIDAANFMITDDLQVTQFYFKKALSLFEQLQIKDPSVLEEIVIEFGTKEALRLLGRSLVSKTALAEIYFPDSCMHSNKDFFCMPKEGFELARDGKEFFFNLELMLNKTNNDVLFAEAGDDFVNQLVSFLTFPLGSVLKYILRNISSLDGCIQNFYSSMEGMESNLFLSEKCRNMLLTPSFPTFYGIKKQSFELKEISSTKMGVSNGCLKCFLDNGCNLYTSASCINGISMSKYIEQDPKEPNVEFNNDEGFVVSSNRFMISDDLHIFPLSVISALSNIEKNLPMSDLVRREVRLDKTKVLSFLNVMLISKATLTDILSPKPEPLMESCIVMTISFVL